MRKSDDRSSGAPARDELESVDAFPPGGEPRVPPEGGEPDESARGGADVEERGGELAAMEQQLAEQQEKYLRLAAEFDNFRKRTMRDWAEAGRRAQVDLIRPMLEVLDDLERFATVDTSSTDAATVVQGVEMVSKKLHKALAAAGLKAVSPLDQTFDPATQEAVATEPAASREDDDTVARVYQTGYEFHGQLVRPARVVVRQWNG